VGLKAKANGIAMVPPLLRLPGVSHSVERNSPPRLDLADNHDSIIRIEDPNV
jgi:hypothetical protein